MILFSGILATVGGILTPNPKPIDPWESTIEVFVVVYVGAVAAVLVRQYNAQEDSPMVERGLEGVDGRSIGMFEVIWIENGGAVLQDSAPYWGPTAPTWQAATLSLSSRCRCPPADNTRILCCWTCGGAVLPVHVAGPSPCRWCHNHSQLHCASCNCGIHFRGQCRSVRLPRRRCHSVPGLLGHLGEVPGSLP